MTDAICPLCERLLGSVRISKHHLIPKSKGGKYTEQMHDICHQTIHAFFTEKELKDTYSTTERLLEDERIRKFISWISSKDPGFYVSTKDDTSRKSKRKR